MADESMKIDGAGLLRNSANQIETPDRRMKDYYSFSLKEMADHMDQVRNGEATLQEFGELYCMVPE